MSARSPRCDGNFATSGVQVGCEPIRSCSVPPIAGSIRAKVNGRRLWITLILMLVLQMNSEAEQGFYAVTGH